MKKSQLTTLAAFLTFASSAFATHIQEGEEVQRPLSRPSSPVLKGLNDQERIELFLRRAKISDFVLPILMSQKTPDAKELELRRSGMGDKVERYLDLYAQACEEVKK